MPSLSVPALRCGGPSHLPYSQPLQAGPLSMLLEQGEIRRIRLGNAEVIRRIYLTVRGPGWETIPGQVSDLQVESQEAAFRVSFLQTHKQGEFDFRWTVVVQGNSDGTVDFRADGKAGHAFRTNRVGICVLHPLRECAGGSVKVVGADGLTREGRFPETISPDQPFLDVVEFSHEVAPNLRVKMAYAGEQFEMEDQRNWTDGSFKTYCPPQALPKPRSIAEGWTTHQDVTLTLQGWNGSAKTDDSRDAGNDSSQEADANGIATMRFNGGPSAPLPPLGFGLASSGAPLGPIDMERLKVLKPSHLRANFRLSADCTEEIKRVAAEAALLGVPLEVAVAVPEAGEAALSAFARAWSEHGGEVKRWLVFGEKEDSTQPHTFASAEKHLRPLKPDAEFASGSKSDFAMLNRGWPPPSRETLAYAVTPQVHLTDNRTMVESIEGQAWTVRTARAARPAQPIAVTAVTLKRAPFALAFKPGAENLLPGQWPWRSQADTRQISLFGAAWAFASLRALALNQASSATYFEAAGLLGLLAGQKSSSDDLRFPGSDLKIEPTWVFPMYHAFADAAEFKGGEIVGWECDQPVRFAGAGMRLGDKRALMVVNLEEKPARLRLEGLAEGLGLGASGTVGIRRLNEKNAMAAMASPESYRNSQVSPLPTDGGGLDLDFLPFEIIRIQAA